MSLYMPGADRQDRPQGVTSTTEGPSGAPESGAVTAVTAVTAVLLYIPGADPQDGPQDVTIMPTLTARPPRARQPEHRSWCWHWPVGA